MLKTTTVAVTRSLLVVSLLSVSTEAIIEFRDEKTFTDVNRFIVKALTFARTEPSLNEAEFWFDNMTIYVDMLDKVNKLTSERLNAKFDDISAAASRYVDLLLK